MKSISEESNLNNKKILLRLDLNVPLLGDKITDTTRIDKILPTLKFLISQNAKIIIISPIAFEAPVDVGTIDWLADLALLGSL